MRVAVENGWSPVPTKRRCSGRRRLRAGGDRDQRAVREEGGVELVDRVLPGLRHGGELLQGGVALGQSLVQRHDPHALRKAVEVGQLADQMAVRRR